MQVLPEREHRIRLRPLLPDAEFFGVDDIQVDTCSRDSRSVQPGDLFVALPGTVHDGHQFIAEAVARGCAAVLTEQPVSGVDVPVCLVPDVRQAYGRLCQTVAGDPCDKLKVIGITGTNGKTTTTCLLSSILLTAGYRTGFLGTLGCFDGKEVTDSSLTTPPADELASALARMVANDCSHAVMEVSSHALDQSRLAGMTLDAACVTNVRRDHLDYHHSISRYRRAKSRVFDYLAGEGVAVINADDPASVAYLPRINGPVLTVGMHAAAEITAQMVERCLSEQTFLLTAGSETIPVRTKMIGTHHVYNCLTAAAVGLAYGIDLTTVVRGLETVEYVPGRLQRIECGQPFGVFVDYAHTPDALAGCLEAVRAACSGRLICVFGAGGDRDKAKRPLMAQAVEAGADMSVVTTDNPRTEDPDIIIHGILDGFQCPEDVQVLPDRAEAIAWALSVAQAGDCVVIAGKGHETSQMIDTQEISFNDYDVASHWLYQNQPDGMSIFSNQ